MYEHLIPKSDRPHLREPKSEEHKRKISETLTGVKKTKEHSMNISKALKKVKHTAKPVMFMGTKYPSYKDCSIATNITLYYLRKMVQSPDLPEIYELDKPIR